MAWFKVSLVDVEGNEFTTTQVEVENKAEAIQSGEDYFREELESEHWNLEVELQD